MAKVQFYLLFTVATILQIRFATAQSEESLPGLDACGLPEDSGLCYALIQRFHYNQKTDTCEVFSWGGCGGNDNNFREEEECQRFAKLCRSSANSSGNSNNTTEAAKPVTSKP